MTILIVARGESPGGGGGDDPWTEGANLIGNAGFETAMPDLPWDDANWNAVDNNETVERVTVNPISGTASLHILTTAAEGAVEGCEGFMPVNSVTSRNRVRLRFTIRGEVGNAGHVACRLHLQGSATHVYILYEAVPPEVGETVQIDLTVPDAGNYGSELAVGLFRPRLYFLAFEEIADCTIDDVYFGILTPA